MNRLTLRAVAAVTAPLAVLLVATGAAHAAGVTPPPTLAGETLNDTQSTGLQGTMTCGVNGAGSYTWSSSGDATGNYVGTYSEQGSAVAGTYVSGSGLPDNPITSLQMSFRIDTPTEVVTGTETLLPSAATPLTGDCAVNYPYGTAGTPVTEAFFAKVVGDIAYTATITPVGGGAGTTVTGTGNIWDQIDLGQNIFVTQDASPTTAPTTTTVTALPNPLLAGQATTLTATVTGPTGNTTAPTGSVIFSSDGTALPAVQLGPLGTASYTATLPVGSHNITASYSGDSQYQPSTGSASVPLVVAAATGSKLITLTGQYLASSAKFQALPAGAKAFINFAISYAAQRLAQRAPALTPAQKAALLTGYQRAVGALVGGGWLTPAQGATLDSVAAQI